MEKYKTVMTGLLAVALCLGLSWGVSPSMAFNQSWLKQQPPHWYKENRFPRSSTFKPFNSGISKNFNNQSFNQQSMHRPYKENRFPRSWTFKPFNSGISKVTTKNSPTLSPSYGKNVVGAVDSNKVRHTDAGAGKPMINIGKPFGTFNPALQNHSKAWQAMQAAKAKAQQDAWNKSGGYGGNGGNGVLPPGPAQVPGSTPPPQANSGPPLCVPDILSGGCLQLDSLHTNAGAGKAMINLGRPFGPNLGQPQHSKAWQAMQAAKAKAQQGIINKIGTPFGTRPQWNRHAGHGGGYGEGGGHAGNGVLPPPNPVPVSTAPTPPPAQSTQPPQATCNPAVDICVH